jgi:3-phenylpropionate/trans-cinnamate dioxygenase ferredoxin reductase subunit
VKTPFALLAIGGGPAGFAAVRAYRQAGGEGPAAIVTDEHRMPYSRPPLTKDLLRGDSEEAELPIEPESWLSQHEVALIGGRAVALHADVRSVALSGGRELQYDTCVLATGAEPRRLPIPGADDPAVLVLRTLDQLRELTARLRSGEPVSVIGSGFIGCEIAASLRMRGHPVTMISDEAAPNRERLGDRAAQAIAGWLREYGIELHTADEVQRIERDDDALTVVSKQHRSSSAVVVMASGVTPRGELATMAGIELAGGAVRVDASMRTEIPHLLAAGDVCVAENVRAGRPLRVEHWGDALAHGTIAGQTAAGISSAWGSVPGFWSTIGEHTLKYAAWGDGFDECRFEPRPDGGFVVSYGRDGQLVGVLSHLDDDAYENGSDAVGRGAPWTA